MTSEQAALLAAILDAERKKAGALIDEWAKADSYEQVVAEILDPVLTEIGGMWTDAGASIAQGYIAGKIAEDALSKAAEEVRQSDDRTATTKGTIVIGNAEDDYHALGRRLLGTFLTAGRWDVVDLGVDVSAQQFIDAACEHNARVVGVSAMMNSTAVNIRSVREEIDRRDLRDRIKLAVGGAVFRIRPELVEEVGGDGTSASALTASALMARLQAESAENDG